LNQLLLAMLFNVSPTDAQSLLLTALLLLAMAALARLIPARQGPRISPQQAARGIAEQYAPNSGARRAEYRSKTRRIAEQDAPKIRVKHGCCYGRCRP